MKVWLLDVCQTKRLNVLKIMQIGSDASKMCAFKCCACVTATVSPADAVNCVVYFFIMIYD